MYEQLRQLSAGVVEKSTVVQVSGGVLDSEKINEEVVEGLKEVADDEGG